MERSDLLDNDKFMKRRCRRALALDCQHLPLFFGLSPAMLCHFLTWWKPKCFHTSAAAVFRHFVPRLCLRATCSVRHFDSSAGSVHVSGHAWVDGKFPLPSALLFCSEDLLYRQQHFCHRNTTNPMLIHPYFMLMLLLLYWPEYISQLHSSDEPVSLII